MPETATVPEYRPQRPPRSFAGPVVLIIIGVIFLLGNMRVIGWAALRHWFAQYWPLLIILWGIIKLLEYFADRSAGRPTRGVGAGGVVLLIFLVLIGLTVTGTERINWGAFNDNMDVDSDFASFFGTTYNFTQELQQEFPANSTLRVESQRGDLTINSWDQPQIKVAVHKRLVADNQDEANRIDQATHPMLTLAAGVVTLDANTYGAGNKPVRDDLEIWLPKKAALELSTRRGDLAVRSRQGDVRLNSSSRGDVTLDDVAGNISLNMRRGSLTVSNITGDVSLDGRLDDVNISQVTGAVTMTGDFFGSIELSRIGKAVSFKSSRTDMELAKLDGDLRMESGDLRANSIAGPVRVQTRSKDVHLDDVAGAVQLEDSNDSVEVHVTKLPLGPIDISNRNGNIRVMVPAKAAFDADVTVVRGDIDTDFPSLKMDTSGGATSRAVGSVGNGGPKLVINNQHGNVEIRKGT